MMKISGRQIIVVIGLFLSNCSWSISAIAAESNQTEQVDTQQKDANKNKSSSSNRKGANIQETVLGMNVSGNKELPNVLYIVPWKSDSTPAPLPEVSRLVDEIYAPVEPEVFTKQVKFFYQLTDSNSDSAKESKD